ncbi:uncharacterized protein DFL_006425 [Arthrobotrys flagrans]|uniref:Uncharacterized protein n=1 Tax=Arthrobotrys flagrans TaxID=97331 RepID=A0A437A0Z5_ARTFL|nr:hypothetical protein DFL_006425 [Arthrobotrys flagrans]
MVRSGDSFFPSSSFLSPSLSPSLHQSTVSTKLQPASQPASSQPVASSVHVFPPVNCLFLLSTTRQKGFLPSSSSDPSSLPLLSSPAPTPPSSSLFSRYFPFFSLPETILLYASLYQFPSRKTPNKV